VLAVVRASIDHSERTLNAQEIDACIARAAAVKSVAEEHAPPRRMAAHRRKRERRLGVDGLSSAVTSETEAKADTVHLGGQVAV
jgi:hypothetical protein